MPLEMSGKAPGIQPVSNDKDRPLWSVMIPTFNCASYLRKTLESVLAVDPGAGKMQIMVVDDHSTKDDPEQVVKELGKGRIEFYRQEGNVGATANFNTCIQLAKGKWVHILHGDDYILPNYYEAMQEGLQLENVGAAFCRTRIVDENGNEKGLQRELKNKKGVFENWMSLIGERNLVYCPSIVVKRSVYEELGGYNEELVHAADWEMWKRISTGFDTWFDPEPAVCYREHSKSDTSKLVRSGANIADTRKSISISGKYLDKSITKRSLEYYAIFSLRSASRFVQMGDNVAAFHQVKESLKCHVDLFSIKFILREILYRAIVRMVRPKKD